MVKLDFWSRKSVISKDWLVVSGCMCHAVINIVKLRSKWLYYCRYVQKQACVLKTIDFIVLNCSFYPRSSRLGFLSYLGKINQITSQCKFIEQLFSYSYPVTCGHKVSIYFSVPQFKNYPEVFYTHYLYTYDLCSYIVEAACEYALLLIVLLILLLTWPSVC